MFIIKTGIEYETKKNYESLRDAYNIRAQYPEISDCMFALPANGQERDKGLHSHRKPHLFQRIQETLFGGV
jgi:hypothetical protein